MIVITTLKNTAGLIWETIKFLPFVETLQVFVSIKIFVIAFVDIGLVCTLSVLSDFEYTDTTIKK